MSAIAGISGDVWLSTSPSTPLLPVKDAVSNASVASASSLTWSHTVGATANMILIVSVAVGTSATCSGVTYNGVALTQLTSKVQGTETVYLFYKTSPATGANNIVATFSGAAAGIGTAVSYSNVLLTSPFGTAASSSSTSGNASNSVVVTNTSQLVLDILFMNGTSATATANQVTETSNVSVAPFYFADVGATATSPQVLTWTNSGSPTIWIEISVALFPNPEACTDSGNHKNYFANVHQAWDPTQPFVIQNSPNGTSGWVNDNTSYQVYWPVGEIVFAVAKTPGTDDHIRIVQGNVFTLTALDGAHVWKLNMKGMTKDVTTFQAVGAWAQNLGTIKSLTYTVDCYRQDARILNEMITSGINQINISNGIILCQLWFDETNGKRWQFYALPTSITQTIAATDIDKQSVAFTTYGPAYVITSNTFTTTSVIQQ